MFKQMNVKGHSENSNECFKDTGEPMHPSTISYRGGDFLEIACFPFKQNYSSQIYINAQ